VQSYRRVFAALAQDGAEEIVVNDEEPPCDEARARLRSKCPVVYRLAQTGGGNSLAALVLDGARAKPEPSAAGHARGHSAAAFPPNALLS
jgi:hypothetical protein